MNKLLLYSLSLFFLGQAAEITKKEGIFVSQKLDSAQLSKNNEGFEPLRDHEYSKIYDFDVHSVLHVLNHDNTIKNFEEYDPAQPSHLSNGEYRLMHKANVHGNGLRGKVAGFWLSKFAVHAAAQTAYALVAGAAALVYPPAAPVVYCSLQLTFAALVEIASNIVASGTTVSDDATGLV